MNRSDIKASGIPRQPQPRRAVWSKAWHAVQRAVRAGLPAAWMSRDQGSGEDGREPGAETDLRAGPRAAASHLGHLSLADFEGLVAQAFRRQGYSIHHGVTGSVGGYRELLLTRPGRSAPLGHPAPSPGKTDPQPEPQDRHLTSRGEDAPVSAVVHVRYWQAWRVGATELRELRASMAARGAGRGILVVPGRLGRETRRLAAAHGVELLDGDDLLDPLGGPRPALRAPQTPALGSSRAALLRPSGQPSRQARWRPRVRIPLRYWLRTAGVLLAAGTILAGFDQIIRLPDKRLPPQPEAAPASTAKLPSPSGHEATTLIPALTTTLAPDPDPMPTPLAAPGPGGVHSVQEIDAAFEAFYLPPPGCASPSSQADLVECANHRIRARRGFMATGTPAESTEGPPGEPEAEAPSGAQADLSWEDEEAIRALVPPTPEPPAEGAESRESEPELMRQARAPHPRRAEEDPAATYAPYDPKAPWAQP